MEQKEKHITRIGYTKQYVQCLTGPYSEILPDKELRVCYSDTSNTLMTVDTSSVNISENPLTGQLDVTIKISLSKTGE